MKPEVYSALVELCFDICRRNGKQKLVWITNRDEALAYAVKDDEMLLPFTGGLLENSVLETG